MYNKQVRLLDRHSPVIRPCVCPEMFLCSWRRSMAAEDRWCPHCCCLTGASPSSAHPPDLSSPSWVVPCTHHPPTHGPNAEEHLCFVPRGWQRLTSLCSVLNLTETAWTFVHFLFPFSVFAVIWSSQQASFPPKQKELFVLQYLSVSIFSPLCLFAVVSLPSFHSSLSSSPSPIHCVNAHHPLLTLHSKPGMRLGLCTASKSPSYPRLPSVLSLSLPASPVTHTHTQRVRQIAVHLFSVVSLHTPTKATKDVRCRV